MNRSITGPFETWRAGIPYACLRGDIERTAGLAIEEGNTTTVRFKQWQPHPGSHDAVSSGSGRAPAREGDNGDRGSSSDSCRASLSRPSGLTGAMVFNQNEAVSIEREGLELVGVSVGVTDGSSQNDRVK